MSANLENASPRRTLLSRWIALGAAALFFAVVFSRNASAQVQQPAFVPGSSLGSVPFSVQVTGATGTNLFYTIDGSAPTSASIAIFLE